MKIPVYGKQRTVTGSYSGQYVERNTSKVAGDVPCDLSTRDRVRDAGGGSDYNSLPTDRPGYYGGPDGFLMGKQISGIDEADPDGSRALQKGWHRKAGFSAEVSRAGNHPSKGTTNMKSRGTDTASPGQGSPAKASFSWE